MQQLEIKKSKVKILTFNGVVKKTESKHYTEGIYYRAYVMAAESIWSS